jgi:crotonobetainyl-CoA:carnitine CoA-transferase CaiB-like acyl-CoA transferase
MVVILVRSVDAALAATMRRMDAQRQQRPLEGKLVVALEQAVAAPLASCRLADAGARVIKLERATGDFARGYDTVANGQSAYFAWQTSRNLPSRWTP